jgi:hypothetical protein
VPGLYQPCGNAGSIKASGRKLAWAGSPPPPEICAKITSAEGERDARHLPHSEEKAKIDVKKRLKTVPKLYQESGILGIFALL